MKIIPLALALLFLNFPSLIIAQDVSTNSLHFEVNRIHPTFFITKEKLKQAQTIIDLNKHYKASWVKTHIAVEISASHKGKIRKVVGKNDMLTHQQKNVMYTADLGTPIYVKVKYIPDNNLKHNDIREMAFTFHVEPENEAQFIGGQQALNKYLQEKVINKIPKGIFTGYKLAAVKFCIDEKGAVNDAYLFWPSEDIKTDNILLETIRNMPDWIPANYSNGTRVKQEFAFTVGNMQSCVVNLLNIHKKEVD